MNILSDSIIFVVLYLFFNPKTLHLAFFPAPPAPVIPITSGCSFLCFRTNSSINEMKSDFLLNVLLEKKTLENYLDTYHDISKVHNSRYNFFYGTNNSQLALNNTLGERNRGEFAIALPMPSLETFVAPLMLRRINSTFGLEGVSVDSNSAYVIGKQIKIG